MKYFFMIYGFINFILTFLLYDFGTIKYLTGLVISYFNFIYAEIINLDEIIHKNMRNKR